MPARLCAGYTSAASPTSTDMSDLSKSLRSALQESALVGLPQVLSQHDSTDGTVKWLFASGSGQAVEAVFIPEPERGTLCISSQVGCALDCAFCATGAQGFNRNLTAAEIVGQVWHANQTLPRRRRDGEFAVTNVVFMGMGEPLANYRNLVPGIRAAVVRSGLWSVATQGHGQYVRPGAATSTDWPTSAMWRWRCRCMRQTMSFAIDLVPINKMHPIAELLDACWRYAEKRAKRFITFEYVMLRGVNDSIAAR